MKTHQPVIAFAVAIGMAAMGASRAVAQTEDEPNNSSSTADAATLPLGNIRISISGELRANNQTPDPRDQDWLKITSSSVFTSIKITITPTGIDGNERITYTVLNAGLTVLETGTVSGNPKEVTINSPGSGDFFIKISDENSLTTASGEGEYKVDAVGVDPTSPPTETTEVESNDDSTKANVLIVPFTPNNTGATVSGKLRDNNQTPTPRDVDWFKFTNPHKFSSMKVKIIPDGIDSNQHISWQILDEKLNVLFEGEANNTVERSIDPTAAGATFFVKVFDDGNLDSNSSQASYSVQVIGVGGVDPVVVAAEKLAAEKAAELAKKSQPTVSDVQNLSVVSGASTAAIPFTVGPVGAALTVSATSSDPVLVPSANIVLGGSAESRTVTIKAAANESGPVTITLSVTDGKLTATDTFVLTVTPGKPQNFGVMLSAKSRPLVDGKFSRQFGRQKIKNKKGFARTIVITNTGKAPLKGLKITKDGFNATDFIVLGYSKKPLAPGKSITITLVFRPKAKGDRQAAIHIYSSEAQENPFDLTLGGFAR